MVVINLDYIIPYHPSLPLQPRASGFEVLKPSNFPLPPPSKSHPLPPRPPLPPRRCLFSQSASPPPQSPSLSAIYRSSELLEAANVPALPASSIDILQTTERNEFDKEFAKLDATTPEGQPCRNPSMDNDKYQQDDGRVSLENITKGWIGDSPQTAPALAHLTYKEEATSPPEPVNSEVSPTHTALVDAQSRNGVLDELPTVDPNDDYNSTKSYNSLTDNVTTDTAVSEIVSRHAPKCPDSMTENTTTPTANNIQAISYSATVEEDSILALAERQQSLHNEHDTSPGDEDVAQTTVHPVNDTASITRASYAPEQPETCAVSKSGSQNLSKSPSQSYSVYVVVPERPSIIATTEQTKTSLQTSSMAKRKRNSVSPSDIDSDDHGDNDYADGNEDGDDSDTLLRPQKRWRRGVTKRQRTGQVRQKTQSTAQRETVLSDEPRHHCQPTGLQDIETIPIRGYLTRQVLLSRVVYSFTFEEDTRTDLLLSNKSRRSPSQDQDEGRQSGFKACSTSKSSGCTTDRRVAVLSKEDKLLMKLKQKDHLPWSEIVKHFPGRTKGSLQVRYSTKLKGLSWLDVTSEEANGLDSRLHESVCSRRHSGYQQRYGQPRA
ncbi:uncharacterized protein P174DRAFT_509554 [Aspergillus novofumigatus IBT 16806]|uniref:Myb-like domain-containing protein n=1 Tax=Aspergillus novofumigatus (strain IBT 16806) TaxID=1392255 RepID=A0A2I1CF79_ASPN1|nr:uncharacterized protein P174DRAFT_509554 [Aspergillus novofumigatus IBT 16806]PKX96261.1 hypothetical protein P174DRAFT_509554 [Aspergillus novofumigatus IBT 16806]